MFYKTILSIFLICLCIACKQSQSENTTLSKDISIQQAAQLHSEGYVYIDLRTPEEIQSDGKIEGAISINFRSPDFDQMISKLPKSNNYIAYCASGGRSSKSLSSFEKHGLKAYNMLGGYGSWKQSQK